MLESILAFVSGSGASIFTRIIGYFTRKKEMEHEKDVKILQREQDRQDHEQEMELRKQSFDQQIELKKQDLIADKQNHDFQIDERELINLQKTRQQQDKILSKDATFIDKLNKSFRPVASYSFLIFFLFYKLSILFIGLYTFFKNDSSTADDLTFLADSIMDEKTEVGFWAIMGFWFTNRIFDKAEQFVGYNKKARY